MDALAVVAEAKRAFAAMMEMGKIGIAKIEAAAAAEGNIGEMPTP